MDRSIVNRSTVLVTGGAGYIGSHACKALAAAGFQPVTFDNLVYGHKEAVRWGPFEYGDLLDTRRVVEVLQKYQPVAVMHFAAFAYVGESAADPAKYYRNNVAGTLSLVEAMRVAGVDKLVFSSTCATYGHPRSDKIAEDHPQEPINPYGRTKLVIERMLREFDTAYGFRSISLRYFNAAGCDPDLETGEDHDPETHLIPLILRAALDPSQPINVHGQDYDTPDGTCIRDYVHVTDLASAHCLALQALLNGAQTTAYNLGNGRGYSVLEVIDAVRRVTGRAIEVRYGPRRAGDPAKLVGDASRIIRDLNWQPCHADIDTIVRTAWNWAIRSA